MTCVEDRVRDLLSRSFKELPMGGDLPRLCNMMEILNVEEDMNEPGDGDRQDFDKRVQVTDDVGERYNYNDYQQSNDGQCDQKKKKSVIFRTSNVHPNNLCQLLATLSQELEPDAQRDVTSQFNRFFVRSNENEMCTILPETLIQYLDEHFGGDSSKVVRLLKSCNQAVIAPVIIELKTALGIKNMTKDVARSWHTRIFLGPDDIRLCTYKREQHLQNLFQYEWELVIIFDRQNVTCKRVQFQVIDLLFNSSVLQSADTVFKNDVKEILGRFCRDKEILALADEKFWEPEPPAAPILRTIISTTTTADTAQTLSHGPRNGLYKASSNTRSSRWLWLTKRALLISFCICIGAILFRFWSK